MPPTLQSRGHNNNSESMGKQSFKLERILVIYNKIVPTTVLWQVATLTLY